MSFLATNNCIVLAVRWSVKYFCWKSVNSRKLVEKRKRRDAITKHFAFQANAKILWVNDHEIEGTRRKPKRFIIRHLINLLCFTSNHWRFQKLVCYLKSLDRYIEAPKTSLWLLKFSL